MKNVFYFMLKAIFVLETLTFLSCLFGFVEEHRDKKAMVNFKIYYFTGRTRNSSNTHITQSLKK